LALTRERKKPYEELKQKTMMVANKIMGKPLDSYYIFLNINNYIFICLSLEGPMMAIVKIQILALQDTELGW
jgi:hypothetical protein